jgi:transcriptional regulator with XRE-family HTH domain
MSQAALAAKAGIHANVIGRTERGIHNPSILTLDAIAAALDTPLVRLLALDKPIPRARRKTLKTG